MAGREQSVPSEKPSDEADAAQIRMAREEGRAYQQSLKYMVEQVVDAGGQTRAGDYIVAFAQERAEGMYVPQPGGGLQWREPAEENCHLEISVSDAGDGRFVPYLKVLAELIPRDGEPIGPFEVPFLWHPGLYHYGRNVRIPGDGVYTIRIRIEPPTFHRHDRVNGRRYAEPVEVEFADVRLSAGRE